MKKINRLEKICIIFLFIILFLFILIVPMINSNINVGKLIINEVMLINNSTIMDKYGKYNDYIELYNGNDYDINLYNYYLTDSMKDTKKWTFPDVTIKSHEYLVVYASGKNSLIDGEVHTNFKLDQDGETIALSNSSAKVISKVYVKKTLHDTSYGYNGSDYVYYYDGTPGYENSNNYSIDPIYEIKEDIPIKINEYMLSNVSSIKAFDNNFYSMLELYNYGESDIDLDGFYLSDKENNLSKYKFPNVKILKNDYLIIYLSGKDTFSNNEIHTNFKVKNEEGKIILSSSKKNVIDKVDIKKVDSNLSYGLYKDKWYLYNYPSFGKENSNNYLKDEIEKKIIINEVSVYPKEMIELKNISDSDINLKGYSIGDKSGVKYDLTNVIKKDSYLALDVNKLGFGINTTSEIIYLYYDNQIIDTFKVNKIRGNISIGINDNKEKVYYKNITMGSKNDSNFYKGFSDEVIFSIDGGYVDKGTIVSLNTVNNANIYYTLDGTFPTNKSKKYTEPFKIEKNTVIKAISYRDGYLESDPISRTFITERRHNIAFVSISTSSDNLYGGNGIISNYGLRSERKASVEFYESNGNLGTSFQADIKLSGMDSRKEPQKSISFYLRKKYGQSKVTYPFFPNLKYNTFSSLVLRNAGEDPKNVRIMDAALTRTLKGEMDIDMQEYRPVVVYLNGVYYGISNMREKLNGDYVESKFGIDKSKIDVIKYSTPTKGNTSAYNKLINYVKTHDARNKDVYEYLKTQIDIEELINYNIVESFYGNTDLGNIRYWKSYDGKWRWMLYDLDWSLWNYNLDIAYPVKQMKVPAATYLSSSLLIVRNLYKNSEFKDLYLKSLAKYLKDVWNPSRMNKIIDELKEEIKEEMPYHIKRWQGSYPGLSSMSRWESNIESFKKSIKNRYNKVLSNLQSNFNLSNSEYKKYFGDLK